MKPGIVILIALLSITSTTSGQSNFRIDSLEHELNLAKGDTHEVNTLNSLSWELRNSKRYDEALQRSRSALLLAERLSFQSGISSANYIHGIIHLDQNQYNEALAYFQTVLSLQQVSKNKKIMANCYFSIGQIFDRQNDYPEALKHYLTADTLFLEIGDKSKLINLYTSLGALYAYHGNDSAALRIFQAGLKLCEETRDKTGIARSSFNIARIYEKQGKNVEALQNYLFSLKVSEEIGSKYGLAMGYGSLGDFYRKQGNFDKALANYESSLKLLVQLEDWVMLAGVHMNIGLVYMDAGNFEAALNHQFTALENYINADNKRGICRAYNNIGTLHERQGDFAEAIKNYLAALKIHEELGEKLPVIITLNSLGELYKYKDKEIARAYFERALALATAIQAKDEKKIAHLALSKLDSLEGNYEHALKHYMKYAAYHDSLLQEANSEMTAKTTIQIAQIKEQYESEKKDKEILSLINEKQISTLLLKSKQDSLHFAQSEKEKIQLENEKFYTQYLFQQQQFELLSHEKRLQELQSEKDQANLAFRQEQLNLLNRENDIRKLELKREKTTKKYFISGLVLFLFLSFFIYRNYRTRQEVKLLTLRNKIASDLHDDIGSTLSSISMFSQMAQAQSKEVIPALETIGESSRKMLDAMADIVWTIKPENDQFDKVIMRMREFAFDLLGTKQIDFEFDTDEDISKFNLSMEARKNLYLIFKEATNNMAKYSEAKRAKFALNGEKDRLTMVISDNGKGFDTAVASRGNGLVNMKKRAEEMGAQLSIISSPGYGTSISLELVM